MKSGNITFTEIETKITPVKIIRPGACFVIQDHQNSFGGKVSMHSKRLHEWIFEGNVRGDNTMWVFHHQFNSDIKLYVAAIDVTDE